MSLRTVVWPVATRERGRLVRIFEFRGDKVARESIYINEGWDAPEWRQPWRAVWVEES